MRRQVEGLLWLESVSQSGKTARKEIEKERRKGKKTKRCRDPDAKVPARCVLQEGK